MFKRAPNLQRGYKYCFRCESAKPDTDFYRNRSASGGLSSQCKPCARATQAASRQTKQRLADLYEYMKARNGAGMIELPTVIVGLSL